jgi:hypothetical protein
MPQYLIGAGLPAQPAGLEDKDFRLLNPVYQAIGTLSRQLSQAEGQVKYDPSELAARNQTGNLSAQHHRKVFAFFPATIGYGKLVNFFVSGGRLAAQLADNTLGRQAHGVVNNPAGGIAGNYAEVVAVEGLTTGISGSVLGQFYYLDVAGGVTNTPPGGGFVQSVGFGLGSLGFYLHVENVGSGGGAPGPTGPAGAAGAPGPALFMLAADGQDGNDGMPGMAGQQGPAGTNGINGLPGLNGPATYLEAEQGDEGPMGPQGIAGIQGAQGIQGVAGVAGLPGPAIYLEADQGLDGDQGPPGIAGQQGLQGIQGVTGSPGATGANGPATYLEADAGLDGDIGPPGATGAQGIQGIPGTAGINAPLIWMPADDPDDILLIPGPKGDIGATGAPGSGGGGSASLANVTVTAPAGSISYTTTVVDANVTATSKILIGHGFYLDTDVNDPDLDQIDFHVESVAAGSFIFELTARSGVISGPFKFTYLIG